jgi:hypothetical protein
MATATVHDLGRVIVSSAVAQRISDADLEPLLRRHQRKRWPTRLLPSSIYPLGTERIVIDTHETIPPATIVRMGYEVLAELRRPPRAVGDVFQVRGHIWKHAAEKGGA